MQLLAMLLAILAPILICARQITFHNDLQQQSFVAESLISELAAEWSKDYQCKTCMSVARSAKLIPELPINIAIKIGTELCFRLGIQPRNVCENAAHLFAPWVLKVVKSPSFRADYFCGANGFCDYPQFEWNVEFPKPKPKNTTKQSLGLVSSEILHFSDYHYDPEYMEGYEAQCKDPICCRDPHAPSKDRKISKPAGKFGEYKCDTPLTTAEAVLEKAKKLVPKPRFILISGDLPPHDIWKTSREAVMVTEGDVASQLYEYFKDNDVYLTVGNHESSPSNDFPSYNNHLGNASWIYESLALQWSHWLPESALQTLRKYGYYSVVRDDGIRIVSLNTNFAYLLNFWNFLPEEDPNGMFKWLIAELQAAEDAGERVFILGHMSPGNKEAHRYYSNAFYKIIQRYAHIIVGQFYGHSHVDEFNVFYADEEKQDPINMAFMAPSITTFTSLNPALRVFELDKTHNLLNHITWAMNLTLSNELRSPQWFKVYDAKSAYSIPDISPKSWDDVVLRMEYELSQFNVSSLLKKFLLLRQRLVPEEFIRPCDEACERKQVCLMKNGRNFVGCPGQTYSIARAMVGMEEDVLC